MTTCEKDKDGSWSDGRPQLSGLRFSMVLQGSSHIFSWIITRLKQRKYLVCDSQKKGYFSIASVEQSGEQVCRFCQIFVGELEEFPNLFIQLKTRAHEYSESTRTSKYAMLLSNFGDEHRRLSPISEAGFHHQLTGTCSPDSEIHFNQPNS